MISKEFWGWWLRELGSNALPFGMTAVSLLDIFRLWSPCRGFFSKPKQACNRITLPGSLYQAMRANSTVRAVPSPRLADICLV